MPEVDLPRAPSRDNFARHCEHVEEDGGELPDHISPCTCKVHTGVCDNCGYKITVSASGVEYGHARAINRGPNEDGVRRDCIHRPLQCNPGEPHAWDGYDQDEWNSDEIVTDGGHCVEPGTEGSQ